MTPSVTTRHGVTAVLLDPPYSSDEHDITYSAGGATIAADVRAWAIAHGNDPLFRIALCGYQDEHQMPASWECVAWKAVGGYGGQRKTGKNLNAGRERLWFSPHCLRPSDSLFSEATA